MTTHNSLQRRLIVLSIILTGCLTLPHTPAYPEAYIAGQFGVTIPGSLSNIDLHDSSVAPFDKSSDFDLQNSFLYGAKLGYYSDSERWFGIEAEVFHTTPHQKQQTQTFSSTSFAVSATDRGVDGEYNRVLTVAANLLFRYPGERLQPYVGIGPALFLAKHSEAGFSDTQSTTTVGLNTQLGLRYFMTKHVALFGEYKFNYARFNFSQTVNLLGLTGSYTAHNFVFGIGYHF